MPTKRFAHPNASTARAGSASTSDGGDTASSRAPGPSPPHSAAPACTGAGPAPAPRHRRAGRAPPFPHRSAAAQTPGPGHGRATVPRALHGPTSRSYHPNSELRARAGRGGEKKIKSNNNKEPRRCVPGSPHNSRACCFCWQKAAPISCANCRVTRPRPRTQLGPRTRAAWGGQSPRAPPQGHPRGCSHWAGS